MESCVCHGEEKKHHISTNSPLSTLHFPLSTAFLLCLAVTFLIGTTAAPAADTPGTTRSGITPKIVGGTTAVAGDWPWMAAIIHSDATNYYYGQFCGGALIAESWVLTAAHCVYDNTAQKWKAPAEVDVVMGLHNLMLDSGDRIDVKQVVGHPDYNPTTFDNDLALLELVRPSSAQPLPLMDDAGNDLNGYQAVIIGWGDTDPSASSSYPAELQQVTVPVVSNTACAAQYPGMISDTMLCAGYVAGGKDSCGGDSGGPLMVQIDGHWYHAGIVSWADGCAQPNAYGVNTRTSEFVDFIGSYVPLPPDIRVHPETVRFGYVSAGSTRTQTVTITNGGAGDLVLGHISLNESLASHFSVTLDRCSGTRLSPARQCSFNLSYFPEDPLDVNSSVAIPSNDPQTPLFQVVVTARASFPWQLFVPALLGGGNNGYR